MNSGDYVPYINRFASADSIVPQPTNPQSFNRYSYVYNNALNFTDPSGHDPAHCADIYDSAEDPTCNHSSNEDEIEPLEKGRGITTPINFKNNSIDSLREASHPWLTQCEVGTSYTDCWNQNGVLQLEDLHQLDEDQFEEMLNLLYADLYQADILEAGERFVYDTPFYRGHYKNTLVCLDDGSCIRRSTLNYVAQGAWAARAGDSPASALFVTQAYKVWQDGGASILDIFRSEQNPYHDSLQMTMLGYYGYKEFEEMQDSLQTGN
jgi:hypothetical protein